RIEKGRVDSPLLIFVRWQTVSNTLFVFDQIVREDADRRPILARFKLMQPRDLPPNLVPAIVERRPHDAHHPTTIETLWRRVKANKRTVKISEGLQQFLI